MTLPSHIGQYRIIRKIGAGGMGLVYLGEHTLLGRRAAVKTLLPTVAANREIVERFFNEARATSAIADPGVIQVFDFGYHVDGTAYIVMELLEGEALSARLDRLGALPLGDALRFTRQVAGSLAAAHARDIVHRDLKPENIFLVRDAEAQGGERTKIIDFGICKMGAGDPMLTEVGAMIGTPVYMSPEQCRGSGEVDPRSDIYAFGCLLFHLLTGRPPFLGEASGDLIVAHLEEEPPPPSRYAPELPLAVDALVLRCLAKAPGDRFASMTELQAALGVLVEQTEVAAPIAAAPPPTVPLGRGFRSVYDANLLAALGGSAVVPGAPGSPIPQALRSRLRFAPPPDTTPPPDPDDEFDELAPLRRRAGIRAALACVLVVGVAAGLIATPLILGEDDAPAGARVVSAPLPAEAPPPAAPAAVAERPRRPSGSAVSSALAAVAPTAPAHLAAAPTEAPPAAPTEAPAPQVAPEQDEARAAGATAPDAAAPASGDARADISRPAPRSRVSDAPRAAMASASRTSRSSRPARPAIAPDPPPLQVARPPPSLPVVPAAAPPTSAPAFAAPAPPAHAAPLSPPTPPAEDLYDTR
ncbi:MAG TPA: serine/threonine-protein kinase [Kofleriaceae bacterium]|nr:serine/threonine-protein kinase [Kofleriaceae bacterium]